MYYFGLFSIVIEDSRSESLLISNSADLFVKAGDCFYMIRILSNLKILDFRWAYVVIRNILQLLLYIQDFELVFAKEDFDILSNYCCWDHAIKFMSGIEPKLLKIYPLLPVKYSELNVFLVKNLHISSWNL